MFIKLFIEENIRILEKGEVTLSQLNSILKKELYDHNGETVKLLLKIEKPTDLILYKHDESKLIREYCRGILTQNCLLDMNTLNIGNNGIRHGEQIKVLL